MVYPALLPLMRTPRLLVDWNDALADLNGLVRFAERRNLVSARVPSHFKRCLRGNIPWGSRRANRGADFTAFLWRLFSYSGGLNVLEPWRPVQPSNGIALSTPLLYRAVFMVVVFSVFLSQYTCRNKHRQSRYVTRKRWTNCIFRLLVFDPHTHTHTHIYIYIYIYICTLVDCVWNVMAHDEKPDFFFRRNGRVH